MAGTWNSNEITFYWNLPTTVIWDKEVLKSEEFRFPRRKHKFYLQLMKNDLSSCVLYLVNPEKIKINLNVNISSRKIGKIIHFKKENLEVCFERLFLSWLSFRPCVITFKCTVAEESNVRGNETHIALLSEDLKNAFLNEEDSDVIFRVRNKTYPAHKVIIRHRSAIFQTILGQGMTEKNKDIVHIEDCNPTVFREFLLYLYTGKMDDLTTNNVFDLYYMADKYDVSQLKLICADFLWKCLTINNICDVISLAMKHCERDLLNHAVMFFIKNAEDVFPTVKWQKFLVANPKKANELIIKAFKNKSAK